MAPVNIAQIDSHSRNTRLDELQNQNLSKNVTLCCAQERKVRFYLGNTQKKKVYCKPRLKLPLEAQTRLSREVSQVENRTRRSRTRLQTARDFDCGRCKTFDDLSSRVIPEPQSIWLIGLRISREIRILAHRNAYFSNGRRDDACARVFLEKYAI